MINSSSCVCGACYSLCIDYNNCVWSFGYNDGNKAGFTSKLLSIYPPKKIELLTDIKSISCGFSHSLCCDYNGIVYSFGSNFFGQLGFKTKKSKQKDFKPTVVQVPPTIQVGCNIESSFCLTQAGYLYSFGNNRKGQLGIGSNESNFEPKQINISNIEYIECGGNYTICRNTLGEYYTWGCGLSGKLGLGNTNSYNLPTLCKTYPDNIISIKCGMRHTLLLTCEGIVYVFGSNIRSQLGIENKSCIDTPIQLQNIPIIKKISCGYDNSMLIDIDNNLWVFGYNNYGQLGLGDTETRTKPILNTKIANIIDISKGGDHTVLKTINDEIYGFGLNNYGQIGYTPGDKVLNPIRTLENIEDIWNTTYNSRQKSARK